MIATRPRSSAAAWRTTPATCATRPSSHTPLPSRRRSDFGPPGLDAERERGPLPERRREREGDRGHDGENCCYLVHGAPR